MFLRNNNFTLRTSSHYESFSLQRLIRYCRCEAIISELTINIVKGNESNEYDL